MAGRSKGAAVGSVPDGKVPLTHVRETSLSTNEDVLYEISPCPDPGTVAPDDTFVLRQAVLHAEELVEISPGDPVANVALRVAKQRLKVAMERENGPTGQGAGRLATRQIPDT